MRQLRRNGATLVAVVIGLVGAFDGDADVVGLALGEDGELHTDLGEVEAGDLFVELLRKDGSEFIMMHTRNRYLTNVALCGAINVFRCLLLTNTSLSSATAGRTAKLPRGYRSGWSGSAFQ